MRFKVGFRGIKIIPENEQDEAYIHDTLGLKKDGDFLKLVARCVVGTSVNAIAYLETQGPADHEAE